MTAKESFEELERAVKELGLVLAKELGIVRLIDWLAAKMR